MGPEANTRILDEIRTRVASTPLTSTLRSRIRDAWKTLLGGVPVAVRTSALQEDRDGASFAGQYLTVLDCADLQSIEQAIRNCWASAWGPGLWAYAERTGYDPRKLEVAIVIQHQIRADAAGVIFTVNPITGHDTELVCEASSGLADRLVSGVVSGDRYTYDWYLERETGRTLAGSEAVLSFEALVELARLAIETQVQFGRPQDVEWVLANGRFWLVQARPITSIGFADVEGEWTTANFRDGGIASDVCTPLLWSLYQSVWQGTLPAYLHTIGLLKRAPSIEWARVFFGRPYWNVRAVKDALRSLPGFNERRFDDALGIEPAYEGDGYLTPNSAARLVRAIPVVVRVLGTLNTRAAANRPLVRLERARLQTLAQLHPRRLPKETLFHGFQNVVERDHHQVESAYFLTAFAATNAEVDFLAILDQLIRGQRFRRERLALLSGLGNLSPLRRTSDLWLLASAIRQVPAAAEAFSSMEPRALCTAFQGGTLPGQELVSTYLRRHGYHSPREHDIRIPSWQEDPLPLFELLSTYVNEPTAVNPRLAESEQRQEFEHAVRTLLAELKRNSRWTFPLKRMALLACLRQLRSLLWWREEMRDLSTQTYHQVRLYACEIGRHLHESGWVENASDVFLLPYASLKNVLIGRSTPAQVQAEVRRNRTYMESFRLLPPPNEIRPSATTKACVASSYGSPLRGIGCSPGKARGRARVVRILAESHKLERGDILITRWFEPAWTADLGLVGALVAETGGQLQHAAVIAREYGIPCVLGVSHATELISDGQTVLVDGERGVIEQCS